MTSEVDQYATSSNRIGLHVELHLHIEVTPVCTGEKTCSKSTPAGRGCGE